MNRKRPSKVQAENSKNKRKKSGHTENNENKINGCQQRNLRKRSETTCATKTTGFKNEGLTDHEKSSKIIPGNGFSDKNDIFRLILESKQKQRSSCQANRQPHSRVPLKRCSIVSGVSDRTAGFQCSNYMKQACTTLVVSLVKNFKLYRKASPFDRRCTVIEWHPSNPSLLAAGSKGGDIILWNIDTVDKDLFIEGRGPGGAVSAMKFDPHSPTKVFTSAVDGKVSLQDFHGKHSEVLLDTMTWDYWYTSMDLQPKENLMVAGDSTGKLTLMSMEGKKSWTTKLHKNKITHAEFSIRDPWLLCTASTDKTCKLWDVRMVKDKNSALYTLEHTKPVNSAYFSLTDGTRLLTTDQQNEIRVYSSPNWHLEQTILHPHRFFQHLTPIKAHWHPLEDIIVIGRYPDDNFPGSSKSELRTVDIFCSRSGKMLCQLSDSSAPGLVSLNKFSHLGERLASTMGQNILIWDQKEYLEEKQQQILSEMMDIGVNPRPNNRGRARGSSNTTTSSRRNMQEQNKHVQKKLNATKTKAKTV